VLKDYGYDGAYHDERISVSVMLENPLDYGLDVADLVFSVKARAKDGGAVALRLEDFTFYIMDESNRLFNTQHTPYTAPAVENDPDDDEPARWPDALIRTGFEHGFLFQDLRIAFYYRLYGAIRIIKLSH
jgi:hypothetical protein